MAADVLSRHGVQVELHDHMRLPGRKFLLAGRGGLNLTHSEPLEKLLDRYGAARPMLEPAIRAFPPDAVRNWCDEMGEPTFVGSSGRIFPTSMRASPLLRKWLLRLGEQGVIYKPNTRWTDFSEAPTILALGGGSWPELGSDAQWLTVFARHGIETEPFQAFNGRQRVSWSAMMVAKFAGAYIKNVALHHGDSVAHGDVVLAADGIEGTPVYALSASLRTNPDKKIIIDLRPDMKPEQVSERLAKQRGKDSFANRYRKALGLSPAAIALMREVKSIDPKVLHLKTEGPVELRRAISSAGGVAWLEVDAQFRLIKRPNTMVIGEMLDWDAPTGGYLLQACFSTGYFAAIKYLERQDISLHPPKSIRHPSTQP
jgi:uncharacterized flavoprotein (TIGR03862 family)